MNKKIFSLLLFITLFSLPLFCNGKENQLSEKEREILLEQYETIKKRLDYLRWYSLKFDIEKKLNSLSYSVIDFSENKNILSKNSSHSYSIASVTKLMSAVVTTENIDTEKEVKLTEKMLAPYGYSPALFLGLMVSANSLLKAALIQSTNDAAESLTYFLEKGEFISLMNKKAKEIGMEGAVFYDAHGLNSSNMATASDLIKLLDYIRENHSEILDITIDDDFWMPDPKGKMLKFKNLNIFHGIEDFVGGKTGYLPEAKQTFVSLFNVNGKDFGVVLLCSKNRLEDIKIIYNWLKENPELK
jgi:D-alanyl-D-alanine carboxypeptidase